LHEGGTLKTKTSAKPVAPRALTAAERRRWHEEWVDKVVLPEIGGLSRKQQEIARKILLKKRDMKLAGHGPRKWDADRKLELLTDYELLRTEGFKASEAHGVLQDAAGTSKVREYLRDARRLFPAKTRKKKRPRGSGRPS
jgi:hypothetical protein